MSCVTCHVSHITCHVSHVTCHILFLFYFLDKVVKLIGGGSFINGAYPVLFFSCSNAKRLKTFHWTFSFMFLMSHIAISIELVPILIFFLLREFWNIHVFHDISTDCACPTHSHQLLFSQPGDTFSWQTGGGLSNPTWFCFVTTGGSHSLILYSYTEDNLN